MSRLAERLPSEDSFRSELRSPTVAARVGLWLGVCFTVCFLTGLVSHYAQNVDHPVPFPASPSWGYRVTQGLHVVTGTAAVPLLLVKLWTVFPRLFARPGRGVRALAVTALERASILALVGSAVFLLVTGLMNSAQWYPWAFSFRSTHYAVAWVAIGSLVVHVAVKLPVIRAALGADVDDTTLDRSRTDRPRTDGPGTDRPTERGGGLSRRGLLRTTWAAAGLAVLATAGSTVPLLRTVSVLAVRTGDGPQGLPVNRSAAAAQVTTDDVGDSFRLTVAHGSRTVELTREDLLAMTQHTVDLPIACVEGWSADATWTGVRVADLLAVVEAPADSDLRVTSLQRAGAFGTTALQASFAEDDRTLLALQVNGETLSLDHGFPCRIIAPNRPGVLQTKWVTSLEVLA
ncbi:molybdopterin-dependent oxidoreductase [Nocardioides sp. Leaf307]|uniref:molybdopterin-dependent oxidoreductase n=1 Tax=Nocardioides sp. Leaf307 TaxID=1736331 RepID=UPI00070355F1|nr:molybdopterin-dependent oxidoreductase [Nocardioides sp. Leaf307]KQQ41369.1 molybdopterin-binding protein [Nocardioides sp. Leaf307]